jgi:hypothetical protein
VVSVFEKPDAQKSSAGKHNVAPEDWDLADLRANVLDVLLQLSIHGSDRSKRKPMGLNSVRRRSQRPLSTHTAAGNQDLPNTRHGELGSPDFAQKATCDLFYYLFEDYNVSSQFEAVALELRTLVGIHCRRTQAYSTANAG